MKVTHISIRLKRDVRHAPYRVSQCECQLTAKVDNLEEDYKELHEDVVFIVEKMVMEERENYKVTRGK